MNIFLADIRGLTLDLQAPAEIDSVSPRQLPGGAAGSFDSAPAGKQQVIEFNMFFDQLGPRQPAPDEAVPVLPGDAWGEYLVNAQVRVTTDGEPALLRPAAVAAALRVTTPANGPGLSANPGAAGESLPAGGKSLPGPVPAAPPGVVVAGTAPGAKTPPMPVAATPSATRAPIDAATPKSTTPAGLELAPRAEPRPETARAAAPMARAIDSLPAAQTAPSDGKRIAASPESPAEARPRTPAPAAHAPPPATAGKPSATVRTTVASEFEFVAANAPAQRAPAAAAAPSLPGLDGRAASPAEALATPAPGHTAVAEAALARSPRSAPAAAPAPVNGAVEMPLADVPSTRGSEPATPTLPAGLAAGAAPAMQATALPAASSAGLPLHLESLALPRQAGSADWGNGLGERVGWMIDQRLNSATIRLDPPTLGKLDVQVRVADDATTITIQAQHAPTRELIEASATRLRDFLQESGFHNVNVDVSQRQDQQQARPQVAPDARDGADDSAREPDNPGPPIADREAAGDGASLIDTFA